MREDFRAEGTERNESGGLEVPSWNKALDKPPSMEQIDPRAMKVLFVYPGIAVIGYDSYQTALKNKKSDAECIYGLSLLAAIIGERGHNFELLDLRQMANEEEARERIQRSDATVMAITVQTPSLSCAQPPSPIPSRWQKR